MGRSLIIAICMLSASCTLRAQQNAPRTSSTNGKTINYNLTVFNPPVPIQPDPARLNQESAINCTILFLSKLHQGDIKGATAATEDPDPQAKMYEAYKVRVGDVEFSKNISELFDGDRYLYELRIGSEHVLISEKHPEGAQTLIEKQGKFWLEDGLVHQSPELKNMMELVNARAEGKLQFK
ncbi:MAG TPA: hypothetical protein VNO32_19190 [Candidatus Acidoferrum sp.]|nr:hypothetical protein [Candidatus Acidoferrum sp.]